MYAIARPFEPHPHRHASPLRWLLAILVGIGALLALPPNDRPALPGTAHIPAPPRIAKPAGPLSSRLRALMKQRAYQRDRNLDPAAAKQLLAQSARDMRGTPEARGAGLADAASGVAAVDALPTRPAPAPALLTMPELVGLTEQQARETLLRLGAPAELIVSDYQDQAKLGDLFAQVPALHVVSSLPRAGEPVSPGAVIVLGVRGPDSP